MPKSYKPRAKKFPHTFQDFIPETEDEITLIKKPSVGAQASMSEIAHLDPILLFVLKIIEGFLDTMLQLVLITWLVSSLEPCYPG